MSRAFKVIPIYYWPITPQNHDNSFIHNQKTIFIYQNGAVTGSKGQNRIKIYWFFFWLDFQMFGFKVLLNQAREEVGEITDSALMWQNLGMFDYEVLLHTTEEEMRVVTVDAFVFYIEMNLSNMNLHGVIFCCFVITFVTLLRVSILKFWFVALIWQSFRMFDFEVLLHHTQE